MSMTLFDWDSGNNVPTTWPHTRHRPGTWQFISTRLCQGVAQLHTLQDDLESLILVLMYYAARYMRHNKGGLSTLMIHNVFSAYIRLDDMAIFGGDRKLAMFTGGGILHSQGIPFRLINNKPLNKLLAKARRAVVEWIPFALQRQGQDGSVAGQGSSESSDEEWNVGKRDPGKAFLRNHDQFISLCESSLGTSGWPSSDAAVVDC